MNAAGVGSGISVCNQTINTCTWADITAASFVFPDTLNRIYNSVSNSSFTGIAGSAASCTFSRSGGTQGGFTSSIQSINNCIDSTRCDGNTQYIYYLTPYNLLNYGAETIQYKSIINQAQTNATYYGKIYTLWDPSSVTLTYNGALSSLTIVSFSGTSGLKVYDYTATPIYYITSTATIAGSATTPNTIYRFYGINRNGDQYYSTNIIACAAYVDTCTWANITYAEFAPPDTAKRIYNSSLNASIVGITGNYTSYTFIRGGGTQGTFTSSIQTGTSCIDPTTDLTANTLYTYTIYPNNKLGYSDRFNLFTTTTNKKSGAGATIYSNGSIYTLADPSGITITPNTAKIVNNIQFTLTSPATTYMSWNNNATVKLYGSDVYAGATTFSIGSNIDTGIGSNAWKDNLTPNTFYVFKFSIINSDGVGIDISASSFIITICSMAIITGTPTFCYPNTQNRIYDSNTNSTITDITGNYSYYIVTRTCPSVSSQTTYVSDKQTNSTFIDLSTNLLSNVSYIYKIAIYNKNDISFIFTTTLNNLYSINPASNANNKVGIIRTLPDPSGVTITSNTTALTPVFTVKFDLITNSPSNYNTVGNVYLFDSNSNSLGSITASTTTLSQTFSPTTYNGVAIAYNTLYTFTFNLYNSEGVKYTSPVTNIPTSLTITICTPARSSSNGAFYSPNTLYTLTNSANNATIYGLYYQCAYYIITRKNMTSSEIVYTKVTTDGTFIAGTGTYSDLSTNLSSNTQYQYTITYYNQIDISGTSYSTFTNPKASTPTPGKIYTLADPLSCTITQSNYNSALLRKPISYANNGYKQVYFYTSASASGAYTNQARLGPYTTSGSTSINCSNPIPANAAITLMVDNNDSYGNTLAVCMRAIPFST